MKFAFLALGALVATLSPASVVVDAAKPWDESKHIVRDWYQKHKKGELTNKEIWTLVSDGEHLMMPDLRNHPEYKELIKLDKSLPVEDARRKMFLKLAELDVDVMWPPSIVKGEL